LLNFFTRENGKMKQGSRKKVGRSTVVEDSHAVSVIVKTMLGTKELELAASFGELAYFEYCRGRAGVPRLLGGYRDGNGKVAWVVEDSGSPIGKGTGFGLYRTKTSSDYNTLARNAPLDLAASIFRCFHSFAEVGGFYLKDLKPEQFTLRDGVIFLVDGPALNAGPVMAYSTGPNGPRIMSTESRAPQGDRISCKPDLTTGAKACGYSNCVGANANPSHKWASDPKRRCEANVTVAPEAEGVCMTCLKEDERGFCHKIEQRRTKEGETMNTRVSGLCAMVTSKTHVYDVASRHWLLPRIIALAENADDAMYLKSLAASMVQPKADQRPSFSNLLASLRKRG
jgi:hypothetical protein